jgi:hypothetical protein
MQTIINWCDAHVEMAVIIGIIGFIILFITLSIKFDGCPSGYHMTATNATVRWTRPDGTFFETSGSKNECLKHEIIK